MGDVVDQIDQILVPSGGHQEILGIILPIMAWTPTYNALLSRTQVTSDMITHLCYEIRDIKRGSSESNNIEVLPVVPNNTPDQSDNYGEDGPNDEGTVYNKLHPSPPTDSPDNPARHVASPPHTVPTRPRVSAELPGDRTHQKDPGTF